MYLDCIFRCTEPQLHGGIEGSAPKQTFYLQAAKHQIPVTPLRIVVGSRYQESAKAGNKQRVIDFHSICIRGQPVGRAQISSLNVVSGASQLNVA